MKNRYVLSCLLLGSALSVSAQKTAVKSNLLSAANGALNAGVEYAFGLKSTFDLSGSINVNPNSKAKMTYILRTYTAVFGEPISTERSST